MLVAQRACGRTSGASGLWVSWEEAGGGGADLPQISPAPPPSFPPAALESVPWPSDKVLSMIPLLFGKRSFH